MFDLWIVDRQTNGQSILLMCVVAHNKKINEMEME